MKEGTSDRPKRRRKGGGKDTEAEAGRTESSGHEETECRRKEGVGNATRSEGVMGRYDKTIDERIAARIEGAAQVSPPQLPSIFVGRPYSPSTPAGVTGQLLFCWLIALGCVVFAIWATVFMQPLGIGDLFVMQPLWIAVPAWCVLAVALNQCFVMAKACHAIRPACARMLRFWTATTAFPCPYCKRTLMPHGDNLFDTT